MYNYLLFLLILIIIIIFFIFFQKYLFNKIYINNLVNIWKNKVGIISVQNINSIHNRHLDDFFLMFSNNVDYKNHIHLIPFEFAYLMKYKNIHSVKYLLNKNKSIDENINLILYNYNHFIKNINNNIL